MFQVILVLHVMIAVCMIAIILVQHGKGADIGATFGAGASNTVFGSSGHTPFLVKLTVVLVVLFFASSIGIGYLTVKDKERGKESSSPLLTSTPQPAAPTEMSREVSAAVGSAAEKAPSDDSEQAKETVKK